MILLALTGSVASTLSTKLLQHLLHFDINVQIILTKNSLPFIDYNQLQSLATHIWTDQHEYITTYNKNQTILHIDLKNNADSLIVAPASANTIAKFANGFADNLLTTTFRAWDHNKTTIIAPAMNTSMYNKSITQNHIKTLKNLDNCKIIPTQYKQLACGEYGDGAMANIMDIIHHILPSQCDLFKPFFPLKYCDGIPVNPHPGAFAFVRKNNHKHTGIDLYTHNNAQVFAIESGTVVNIEHFTGEWDNSPWWNNTDCLLIKSQSGTICYGEIKTHLKIGQTVHKGQHIANVQQVIKDGHEHYEITGWQPSMLHLELYPHNQTKAYEHFNDSLLDPTTLLLNCPNKPSKLLTYNLYNPS
jgi:phosphopantothenoylcysteine synthetase/decarboxylase